MPKDVLGVVNVEEVAVLWPVVADEVGEPGGGEKEELECDKFPTVQATEGLLIDSRDDLRGPGFEGSGQGLFLDEGTIGFGLLNLGSARGNAVLS